MLYSITIRTRLYACYIMHGQTPVAIKKEREKEAHARDL